jgi:hypothetical protein
MLGAKGRSRPASLYMLLYETIRSYPATTY